MFSPSPLPTAHLSEAEVTDATSNSAIASTPASITSDVHVGQDADAYDVDRQNDNNDGYVVVSQSGDDGDGSSNLHQQGGTPELPQGQRQKQQPQPPKYYAETPPPPPTVSTPIDMAMTLPGKEESGLPRTHYRRPQDGHDASPSAGSAELGTVRKASGDGDGGATRRGEAASKALALLQEIPDDVRNFDQLMKERRKVRRDREDSTISALRVQVRRLEAALAAESKRRVNAVKEIEERAQQELQIMEQTLRQEWKQEQHQMEQRMTILEQRIEELEHRWEGDTEVMLGDIQKQSSSLQQQINDIKYSTEKERADRLDREGGIVQQLEDTVKEFTDRWKSERSERTEQIQVLHDTLKEQEQSVEKQILSIDERIQIELSALSNDIQNEIVERQLNDEQIVDALNRYTQQLQSSLSIVSGV